MNLLLDVYAVCLAIICKVPLCVIPMCSEDVARIFKFAVGKEISFELYREIFELGLPTLQVPLRL